MQKDTLYTIVDTDSMDMAVSHLNSVSDMLGFDTETNKDGSIHFIQIYSPVSGQTYIFYADDPEIGKLTSSWGGWRMVGHNLQFDLSVCLRQFGSYPSPAADTYLIACSLQEAQKGLKPLCSQYFGFPAVSWEDLFMDYDYSYMDDAKWHYVANDPYYAYLLFEYYRRVGAYGFVKKAHEIDIGAMVQYMEASVRGIVLDQEKFAQYLEKYTRQVAELQENLDVYAGWEVRTTSTKDLKKLLFEQMGLPKPPITTDKGEVSVSKEALSYVPDTDGIVSLISQIKEARSVLAAMKNL